MIEYGKPFYLPVSVDQGATGAALDDILGIYATGDDALAALSKDLNVLSGEGTVYYCVPIGKADGVHASLDTHLEWLARAAQAIEGGGNAATEGLTLS